MCDFVFPELKVIIECDGDFWHANPVKYASKKRYPAQKNTLRLDKAKNAYIKKVDGGTWELHRFWETDIKKNVGNCVNQIKELKAKN